MSHDAAYYREYRSTHKEAKAMADVKYRAAHGERLAADCNETHTALSIEQNFLPTASLIKSKLRNATNAGCLNTPIKLKQKMNATARTTKTSSTLVFDVGDYRTQKLHKSWISGININVACLGTFHSINPSRGVMDIT
jgi:hypothetical protein